MKTFLYLAFTVTVWAICSAITIRAQTTVYYGYDACGNRISRTITLPSQKSAKIDSSALSKTGETANTQAEVFQDNLGEQKVLIYPNPTRGAVKVEIQGTEAGGKASLYLYSFTGRLLIGPTAVSGSNTVDLTTYPVGTYVLKIVSGDKTSEWKIIKE